MNEKREIRKKEDEKIRKFFNLAAYRAYVYFYYNPDEAKIDEAHKQAIADSKDGAIRWLKSQNKEITGCDNDFFERLLDFTCLSERERYLERKESYKQSADLFISAVRALLSAKHSLP